MLSKIHSASIARGDKRMRIKGNTIYLVRGDTASITVTAVDQNDVPRPFVAGDTVYFTVKKSTRTEIKEFQKILTVFDLEGNAVFDIEHTDTSNMGYGTYFYDVQLTTVDQRVITIIPASNFILEEEVTYE